MCTWPLLLLQRPVQTLALIIIVLSPGDYLPLCLSAIHNKSLFLLYSSIFIDMKYLRARLEIKPSFSTFQKTNPHRTDIKQPSEMRTREASTTIAQSISSVI